MIDVSTPNSPGWWLKFLLDRMLARSSSLALLKSYMNGDAPLPEGAEGLREAYRAFQRKARTNVGALIVEAPVKRMAVAGFRVGDAEGLDKVANRIWSANELDTYSGDIHEDMLGLRHGYAIVGAPDDRGIPAITHEDCRNVITYEDPVRHNTIAALKLFRDDAAAMDYAYLYLPGAVYVAERGVAASPTMTLDISGFDWNPDKAPMRWPRAFADVVPVVPFYNKGRKGEFEEHTDTIDRINYVVLQRLVIIALQAFHQRAVEGGNLPEVVTDTSGEPVRDANGNTTPIDYNAVFRPGPGSLWLLPEGAKLWESQTTDIGSILTAAKDDIRTLAAETETPMSMLLPDSANQSTEGALAAERALVWKVEDRIKRATYGWNKTMSLALRFAGIAADVVDMETLWLSAERQSLAERADAASKLIAAQVPWETVMTDVMQFSPEKVEEMQKQRMADALAVQAMFAPTTPPTVQTPMTVNGQPVQMTTNGGA